MSAADDAYDRLHGADGHIQSVTPGRVLPAYHEHDAAGCLDCGCNAAPWSSKTPCTCPTEDAATLAALDRLRVERDEHQRNALEMAQKADLAERRAEEAEYHVEQLRDARDSAERKIEHAEAEVERLRDALLQVRRAFDLQCPPMPVEKYVDRGAWVAHSWWNTVLGGILNRGEVGTGAGEGATGQDTGTAWVTRSTDCPEAPAQAHLPSRPCNCVPGICAEGDECCESHECPGLCGEHHWLDRPESDTRECLICGTEATA